MGRPEDRARRIRVALIVLLAINSGAADAVSFIGMGGSFSSVMTGNMVLLGLSIGRQESALLAHVVAALLGYVLGCTVGARMTDRAHADHALWPASVTKALCLEAAIFVVVAVGWEFRHGSPGEVAQILLLGASAVALGIQSSAVLAFGVSGLSTTYLTGTMTKLVMRLSTGRWHPQHALRSTGILCGLICGAVGAGALTAHAPLLAPVVSLISLAVVIGVAARSPALREGQ